MQSWGMSFVKYMLFVFNLIFAVSKPGILEGEKKLPVQETVLTMRRFKLVEPLSLSFSNQSQKLFLTINMLQQYRLNNVFHSKLRSSFHKHCCGVIGSLC